MVAGTGRRKGGGGVKVLEKENIGVMAYYLGCLNVLRSHVMLCLNSMPTSGFLPSLKRVYNKFKFYGVKF